MDVRSGFELNELCRLCSVVKLSLYESKYVTNIFHIFRKN